MKTIRRKPELINQPNALGQTALHLSVGWPEGLQQLLEAGANVDTVDICGYTPITYAAVLCLHESFRILAGTQCGLHFSRILPVGTTLPRTSLLQHVTEMIFRQDYGRHKSEALKKEAEMILYTLIRLVVERRRKLEALIRTSLDAKAVEKFGFSTGSVLDRKASYAISMLREKMDVPA